MVVQADLLPSSPWALAPCTLISFLITLLIIRFLPFVAMVLKPKFIISLCVHNTRNPVLVLSDVVSELTNVVSSFKMIAPGSLNDAQCKDLIDVLIHVVPLSVSEGERDALNKRIFTSVSRFLLTTKRFAAAI